jgi:cell division septum initiation protein DivIVA
MMRVLAALYESRERPTEESKVEEFLRKHMGEIVGVDYDAMKKENEELKRKNAQLTKRVEELERAQDQ